MKFTKLHGLGNDFIILDKIPAPLREQDLPSLARLLCSRRLAVGADGLVLVLPSSRADFRMRIFNPDGSEAEMCGNAIRCCARYVYDRKYTDKSRLKIETAAGIMVPELLIKNGHVAGIKVDMGEPRLERRRIPMKGDPENSRVIEEKIEAGGQTFSATCLSMGNPHCVIFTAGLADFPVHKWGPLLENHPLFPQKTNVEFVEVLHEQKISMRVWERGAGETLACGTGACAALAAAFLTGKTGRQAAVLLPLGELEIEWQENNHIFMTGPAEEVFFGEISPGFLKII